MARWLIILGIVFIALGLLWPFFEKNGFGKLPGDIVIKREHFTFYFPLTSSLLISAI